jgi:hypothetical protein
MQYDIAVGCGTEEMKIVSLLHVTIINTPMKRGINSIHDTYELKYHQNEECECIMILQLGVVWKNENCEFAQCENYKYTSEKRIQYLPTKEPSI